MELNIPLKNLADKILQVKDKIANEESTKHAFVLPFINLLGYDSFNPTEVVPEYTADMGLKKGEKVDYAIFQNNSPILIIECKNWQEDLSLHNAQLSRYFHVTQTRFALLTNGIEYRFYSDLEEANIMDERPFLEFDITSLKENTIPEIAKFHKSNFDIDKIVTNASALKYTKEIKKLITSAIQEPKPEFVKLFANQVYSGRLTERVMDEFTELVKKAFNQTIGDKVNDRLNYALHQEVEKQSEEELPQAEVTKINTTQEELDAYRIVIAILRRTIPIDRITYRDTQSYFSILLDNNNRKPICRLHLEGTKKYISLFDEDKKIQKEQLQTLNDIYSFEKQLLETLSYYENEPIHL